MIENNKLIRVMANKEIILSAGSVGSPQILMLSGVGPKEHLQKFGVSDIPSRPTPTFCCIFVINQSLILSTFTLTLRNLRNASYLNFEGERWHPSPFASVGCHVSDFFFFIFLASMTTPTFFSSTHYNFCLICFQGLFHWELCMNQAKFDFSSSQWAKVTDCGPS